MGDASTRITVTLAASPNCKPFVAGPMDAMTRVQNENYDLQIMFVNTNILEIRLTRIQHGHKHAQY